MAEEGPNDGHTFRITHTSRGSAKVVGETEYSDADWWGEERTFEVRGWSLRDALRKAVDMPFAQLMGYCCENVYECPKSGEVECRTHGGFDTCCDHPDCPGNRRAHG